MENLDNKVLRYVGSLSRAINSKADFNYRNYNLQKGQYMFLTRVCENEGINFIDLSNMLKVDKTTTTKAIKKLIEIGYLYRVQDEKDRRESRLFPSEKGLNVYDLIIKEEKLQLEITFKDFSLEERELATKLIKKMSENIEYYWFDIKNS